MVERVDTGRPCPGWLGSIDFSMTIMTILASPVRRIGIVQSNSYPADGRNQLPSQNSLIRVHTSDNI